MNKPEDKFKTMLFLPPNPERKGEGGLRTKGYFKHSCKRVTSNKVTSDGQKIEEWRICDTDGNPVKKAPEDFENKINSSLITHHSSGVTDLPLISIITVVYNGAKYLEETIQSVINQTYPNVEYIIIDGGSTDGTLDIIKKYENKIDYWVSERDKGISDAFNKGILVVSNGYIQMLNAGDKLLSIDSLEDIVDYLIGSIISFETISTNGRNIGSAHYEIETKKSLARVPHQSTFVNKEVYMRYGLYSTGFKIRMDYEYFARIGQFCPIKLINKELVLFDSNGISSSLKYKLKFGIEGIIIEYLYFDKSVYRVLFMPWLNFFKSLIGSVLRKLGLRK